MRVNIIGKSNGVGLDRDAQLLMAALRLAGHDVVITKTGSRESGRRKSILFKGGRYIYSFFKKPVVAFDLNIMLEHVWIQFIPTARKNIVIPNPDFFDKHDISAVRKVDQVWAKTQNAIAIFKDLHSRVKYLGFDSEDRFLPQVERKRVCFHLAGSSQLKGTKRLLDIWSRHSHWPELWVIGRLKFSAPNAENIEIFGGYMDDILLKEMQNQAMIHICTSEAEGWGHYLVEAMSVGAAVVTVDAPPMNTMICDESGWLLPCRFNGRHGLVDRYLFDEPALEDLMHEIIEMPQQVILEKGRSGRNWFLNNRSEFINRIRFLIDDLFVNDSVE